MANKTPVLLYYPNIIGYLRIISLIIAYYYMQSHTSNYKLASFYYLFSWILDALDGFTARYFNQCSKFGWVLDMVIDKTSTACLLMTIGRLYPEYQLICQLWFTLDIFAHWTYQMAMALNNKTSHKDVEDESIPFLVKIFYKSRKALFFICAGCENFFAFVYIDYYVDHWVLDWLLVFTGVITVFKTVISVSHFKHAVKLLVKLDESSKKDE